MVRGVRLQPGEELPGGIGNLYHRGYRSGRSGGGRRTGFLAGNGKIPESPAGKFLQGCLCVFHDFPEFFPGVWFFHGVVRIFLISAAVALS